MHIEQVADILAPRLVLNRDYVIRILTEAAAIEKELSAASDVGQTEDDEPGAAAVAQQTEGLESEDPTRPKKRSRSG